MPDDRDRQDTSSRALEIAVEARAMILEHTRACAERYERIVEMFESSTSERREIRENIEETLKQVHSAKGHFLVALVMILVSALAYFLVRYGLTGTH